MGRNQSHVEVRQEQDRLAKWVLSEIAAEQRWDAAFRQSADQLSQLAAQALSEHRKGNWLSESETKEMIKEFDVVPLTHDLPEGGVEGNSLKAGTRGAIVERYNDCFFAVEFFNDHGETVDVVDVTSNDVRVLSPEEADRK